MVHHPPGSPFRCSLAQRTADDLRHQQTIAGGYLMSQGKLPSGGDGGLWIGPTIFLVLVFCFCGPLYQKRPDPSIEISPSSGPPGTRVTVAGAHFPADADVVVTFHETKVGQGHSDGAGGFKVTVRIPRNKMNKDRSLDNQRTEWLIRGCAEVQGHLNCGDAPTLPGGVRHGGSHLLSCWSRSPRPSRVAPENRCSQLSYPLGVGKRRRSSPAGFTIIGSSRPWDSKRSARCLAFETKTATDYRRLPLAMSATDHGPYTFCHLSVMQPVS